jgi:hypothetical protein
LVDVAVGVEVEVGVAVAVGVALAVGGVVVSTGMLVAAGIADNFVVGVAEGNVTIDVGAGAEPHAAKNKRIRQRATFVKCMGSIAKCSFVDRFFELNRMGRVPPCLWQGQADTSLSNSGQIIS